MPDWDVMTPERIRQERLEEIRRAAAIKAEVSIALDTAVAALVGVEFMGTERRRELAAMLTRARLAVEESL